MLGSLIEMLTASKDMQTQEIINSIFWSDKLSRELKDRGYLLITFKFINFNHNLDDDLLGIALILKQKTKKKQSIDGRYHVILVTGNNTREGVDPSTIHLNYNLDSRKNKGCISVDFHELPIALISYMHLIQNTKEPTGTLLYLIQDPEYKKEYGEQTYIQGVKEIFSNKSVRNNYINKIEKEYNSIT